MASDFGSNDIPSIPEQHRYCQICQHSSISLFARKPSFDGRTWYTMQKCGQCGFIWVEPFPGYGIYDDDYYCGKGPDPYVDYASEYQNCFATPRLLEFENLWQLALEHLLLVDSPAGRLKLLDYGCGAGGFIEFVSQSAPEEKRISQGLEVHGFDLGSYAERLASRKGFKILSGAEVAACAGQYDVITCIEVLEHCQDVNLTMASLSRMLRPGGLLILTTGNLHSIAAKIGGANYRYLIPDIHVSLFNPACLSLLYQNHGLAPTWHRYKGAVEYKIIKTLRSKLLKSAAAAIFWLPGALYLIDLLYGVSAMPCAVKPAAPNANSCSDS